MEDAKKLSNPTARACGLGCVSSSIKVVVALIIIVGALYLSSITLSWVNLIGITDVPPGVMYVSYTKP